jgi:hypothetical protein
LPITPVTTKVTKKIPLEVTFGLEPKNAIDVANSKRGRLT